MVRLIDADKVVEYLNHFNDRVDGNEDFIYGVETAIEIINKQPTVEPTLYGYKIEHLALIARVMQKEGVTPERAVQIFKDVQTIALKVIDEINGIIERTFEQLAETRGSGDDKTD